MNIPRLLFLGPLLALLLLIAACGGESSATPETSPSATATVEPTAAPTSVASSDVPTKPGPQPGVACPVAVVICEFAVDMEKIVKAGDVDAFFAAAAPVSVTCSGDETTAGVSAAMCQGAAAGEVRQGYWALKGGTALVVTPAELRTGLERWFDAIGRASATSDAYGPGAVRIGAISCTRQPDQKSGDCIGNSLQIHFTFINPETNVDGTGTPGQRITFHISASVVNGTPHPNGLGTVAPPNSVLTPSVINIKDGQGNPLIVEVYPWTQ